MNTCQAHEFECRAGECVDKTHRCDGHRDCSNSADEFNCSSENRVEAQEEASEGRLK